MLIVTGNITDDRPRHVNEHCLDGACSSGDISKEAGGMGKEVDVMEVSEDKEYRYEP